MVDYVQLFDHNHVHNHKSIFQKMIERQPADKSKLNKYCNCIVTDADTNDILCEYENTRDKITTHAEINCLKFLIRNNLLNRNLNLYLTKSPCVKCFHFLRNLKIKNIFYFHFYEDDYRNYFDLVRINQKINNYEIDLVGLNIKLIDHLIQPDRKEMLTPLKIFHRETNVIIELFFDNGDNIIVSTNNLIKILIELYKHNFVIKKIMYNNSHCLPIEKMFFIIMDINYEN